MKHIKFIYSLLLATLFAMGLTLVAGPVVGFGVAFFIWAYSLVTPKQLQQAFFDIAGSIAATQDYSLISAYDIRDREFRRRLGMKVPRASALSWMRQVQGRMNKRRVKQKTYYYYEEGQFFKAAIKIGSVANTDIGGTNSATNVTITLHADSVTTKDGKYYSYPVKNQAIVFKDETVGFVVAVEKPTGSATHKIEVKPFNASQDVQSAALANATAVLHSNNQPEKSIGTDGRVPDVTKVTNGMSVFREAFETTDFEEQNEVEFEYNGSKYLYVKGTDDTADRFELQEELGLLITPAAASLTDADGNAIVSANGLIPQIDLGGKKLEYYDQPSMTDFDDTILLLNKNYGDSEYVIGMGLNLQLKMKNLLKDFMKNNTDVFFSELKDKGQSLKFDFQSIEIAPYKFHFQGWDVFNHADSLGAGDMPYKDMAIWMPMGYAKNPMPAHVQGGVGEEYEPYIQVTYSNPGGSPQENKGDYKLFETGANARSGATDDEMTRKIHWVSYKGLELRCRHKFLTWRKGA